MKFIPLSIPNFEGNESKYVNDALDQGWVSTGGAYITKLEQEMANFLHTQEVAACQSGTAGLHLSLVNAGVEPNDMVIVPTLTFIAAVNPVRYQFAEPVFMDCDDSLCMDPVKLRKFCETECTLQEDKLVHNATGKHVKAVVVVHVFGNLADMEAIMEIAKQYHLVVVEDAEAQFKLAQMGCDNKVTVRDFEKMVKNYLNPKPAKPKMEQSLELKDMVSRMQRTFATKVSALGNDKKGRIYIDYYNRDDLDRIIEILEVIEKNYTPNN